MCSQRNRERERGREGGREGGEGERRELRIIEFAASVSEGCGDQW